MQNYTTIVGVIELRQDSIEFRAIQRRYRIGSSTINLILERFTAMELTLDHKHHQSILYQKSQIIVL